MAEYYAVLSKAVAGLEANSPDARRAVYDKARNALIGQLKAIDPPLPTAEISRQRLELEEAIRRVEREASSVPAGSPVRVPRPQPATQRAPEPAARAPEPAARAPEPAIASAAAAAAPPPASARRSPQDIFRKAIRDAERDVADEPRVERAPVTAKLDRTWTAERADRLPPAPPPAPRAQPQPVVDREPEIEPSEPEPRLAPEYDHEWEQPPTAAVPVSDTPVVLDDEEDLDRPAQGRRGRRARREATAERPVRPSRLPQMIVLVLIVAILGGVGALAWSQRDIVLDLASGLLSTTEPGPAPASVAATAPSAGDEKDDDRLLGGEQAAEADVRVVAPSDGASEGQPVATASLEAPAFAPAEQPGAAMPEAFAPQRAVLYEEPLDAAEAAAGVIAINAAVTWSYVPDGINGPEIVADLDVPERNLKLKIAIRRNTDATLPASHIVEVVLDVPGDFAGRGVRDIPRIVFKPSEDARGQPLIGASAQVAPGFFWIALSGVDVDVRTNRDLLSDRMWIDLPLVYETGQRAILTFEKGDPGEQVFSRALAAWGG